MGLEKDINCVRLAPQALFTVMAADTCMYLSTRTDVSFFLKGIIKNSVFQQLLSRILTFHTSFFSQLFNTEQFQPYFSCLSFYVLRMRKICCQQFVLWVFCFHFYCYARKWKSKDLHRVSSPKKHFHFFHIVHKGLVFAIKKNNNFSLP